MIPNKNRTLTYLGHFNGIDEPDLVFTGYLLQVLVFKNAPFWQTVFVNKQIQKMVINLKLNKKKRS